MPEGLCDWDSWVGSKLHRWLKMSARGIPAAELARIDQRYHNGYPVKDDMCNYDVSERQVCTWMTADRRGCRYYHAHGHAP